MIGAAQSGWQVLSIFGTTGYEQGLTVLAILFVLALVFLVFMVITSPAGWPDDNVGMDPLTFWPAPAPMTGRSMEYLDGAMLRPQLKVEICCQEWDTCTSLDCIPRRTRGQLPYVFEQRLNNGPHDELEQLRASHAYINDDPCMPDRRDELECGAPHIDRDRVELGAKRDTKCYGDFGLTAEQRKRMEGFGNFS